VTAVARLIWRNATHLAQWVGSFSVIGPEAVEQPHSSVASESGGRSGKPEMATRQPVQKPQRPRVDGTLIYETAIWDSADAQPRNLRSGRRENVREQIPKLTRQPDRGILRAMDRGAVGVLQQVDSGGHTIFGNRNKPPYLRQCLSWRRGEGGESR
jgi:hypothetical protein